MKESRLADLFSNLDKKERSDITKALEADFFNVRNDVKVLWQLLCKSDEIPTKEQAFAAMYPDLIYDAQKVRAVMSWLLAIVKRVLAIRSFEQDEVQGKVYLLQQFRKKNLPQHFKEMQEEITTTQQRQRKQDSHFFQQRYAADWQSYEFYSINQQTDLNLQQLSDTLDAGFMVEKLRQSCFLLAHQTVFRSNYDTGLLNLILSHIEASPKLLDIPAIYTYYYAYLSLKDDTQIAHFECFRKAILTYNNLFSESDIRDLYLAAVNYCIKKHNSLLDEAYARQGLELYKKGLSEGFLLENNTLSRFTYNNIVAWSLLEKDFTWTEWFINEYRNRLERTYRDSMYSFCLSRLEYSRKNYDAAMQLLQRAEYRDTLLALAAKTMLLKIYYELDEYDALEAHLVSMRAYIKRRRVLGYHKTNYLNIINFTQKLMMLGNNKQKINDLREVIERAEVLTEKEWLLAQL